MPRLSDNQEEVSSVSRLERVRQERVLESLMECLIIIDGSPLVLCSLKD